MNKETRKAREDRFRVAQAKRGFIQLRVWVPKDKADNIRRQASKYREATK